MNEPVRRNYCPVCGVKLDWTARSLEDHLEDHPSCYLLGDLDEYPDTWWLS